MSRPRMAGCWARHTNTRIRKLPTAVQCVSARPGPRIWRRVLRRPLTIAKRRRGPGVAKSTTTYRCRAPAATTHPAFGLRSAWREGTSTARHPAFPPEGDDWLGSQDDPAHGNPATALRSGATPPAVREGVRRRCVWSPLSWAAPPARRRTSAGCFSKPRPSADSQSWGASRAACSAPSPEPERARDAGRRRTRATRPLLWVLQFIGGDDALLQISCGSGVSVAWTSRRRTVAIAPQGHRAGRSQRATADAASARGRSFPLSKRLPSARAPPGHYRRPLRYCVARPSRPMTASMSSTTAQATTAIACASGSDMSTTGKRLHNATWPLLGDPRS